MAITTDRACARENGALSKIDSEPSGDQRRSVWMPENPDWSRLSDARELEPLVYEVEWPAVLVEQPAKQISAADPVECGQVSDRRLSVAAACLVVAACVAIAAEALPTTRSRRRGGA